MRRATASLGGTARTNANRRQESGTIITASAALSRGWISCHAGVKPCGVVSGLLLTLLPLSGRGGDSCKSPVAALPIVCPSLNVLLPAHANAAEPLGRPSVNGPHHYTP